MKRLVACLMALILLLQTGAVCAAEDPVTTTVMIYMCGSNLESEYGLATGDIAEMGNSGFTPRTVDVVLMTGGSSQWSHQDVRADASGIYEVRGSSLHPLWEGEPCNMGDGDTLSFFLNTVYQQYDSDRYILIFWNHGGGPISGVCWDENFSKDSLTLPEIIRGLENSPFRDRKLDMIGFDACLMGSVETAWQLSGYAHYMVASEETEPGSGWNYSFLQGIEYDASPTDTARRIIDLYIDSADPSKNYSLTLACIDLGKIHLVIDGMDHFFSELNSMMSPRLFLDMSNLRYNAQSYGRDFRAAESADYDLVDLHSLLQSFDKYGMASGAALKSALEEAVVYARSTHGDSCGLSVYFPYFNLGSYAAKGFALYDQLDFCPGYASYINTFHGFMTSGVQVDWTGLTPAVVRTEDGFEVVLPLTEEQRSNMISARLVVFETDYLPDSANAFYYRIYASTDITVHPDGALTAPYHDECLVVNCRSDAGLDTYSDSGIPFYLLDNGSFHVPVMAANIKEDYIHLAADDEPGVSHLMQISLTSPDADGLMYFSSVQGYDSMTDSFTSRMNDAPENYQYLHFVSAAAVPTRRNGLLLPYELWTPDFSDYVVSHTNSYPADSSFSYQFRSDISGIRCAAFEITDRYGNSFTTELVPLRPLEEVTLYECDLLMSGLPLTIHCRIIAVSGTEMVVTIDMENHSGTDYAFNLADLVFNDVRVNLTDDARAVWLIPAQSTSSVCIPYTLESAFLYGTVISDMAFVLNLFEGSGSTIGTTPLLTLHPNVNYRRLGSFFR
ncbi:MAG: hypothetical protein IKL25_05440 [Clostridia bacterium]|nr:hypothetical protein [Clostridia bacterium]